MSIRFAFGAKARKKEALIQAVRSLAESGGQGVQEDNDHIWISFCPMRCIILTVSNTYIDAGGYAHE